LELRATDSTGGSAEDLWTVPSCGPLADFGSWTHRARTGHRPRHRTGPWRARWGSQRHRGRNPVPGGASRRPRRRHGPRRTGAGL